MKIKAELQNGDILETDVPTNSKKIAITTVLEHYPRASILEVDGRDYIGRCENTGFPILEGDDYEEDESGVMWHI